MVKVLSQAGNSLADIYDVKGSIAGIDELETRELPIFHEMGATVFSERFSTQLLRASTGAIAQNTDIGLTIPSMPDAVARLLAVAIITDDATRILHCTMVVRDPVAEQEFPVWIWDEATSLSARMIDNAQVTAVFDLLVGSVAADMLPSFMGGTGQPQTVDELVVRGRTTGFGAGDVTVTALAYVAFSLVGGVSSRGLPIPSW